MRTATFSSLLFGAGLCAAFPLNPRAVTLDPKATAEAQKRDDGATRAFSGVPIKTNGGQCLLVESGSGDFRENLVPVKVAACDGSAGQQWDVITKGVHNDQAGQALVVSKLTNACLNFDPRRAAGNQVLTFSCGGRADGDGKVTDSQLFAFAGASAAGPLPLLPKNGDGKVCLVVKGGALDQTACDGTKASGDELFTFGTGGAGAQPAPAPPSNNGDSAPPPPPPAASSAPPATATTAQAATTTTAAAATSTDIAVARAGGKLDVAAVAESQKKDTTATRAFTGVSIKSSAGQCLSVDANAGDFRENLIPVTAAACDGSAGQKFDVITKGVHNDQPGFALIVSGLTNGCLNVDPRRAAGDQVLLFSCGGRADGDGKVTDGQLFDFTDGTKTLALTPGNGKKQTCLVVNGGKLDVANCNKGNDQQFTFA